ncbi:hypothetical protein ACOMHN_001987 [Nucella lapillus]
MKGGWWCLCAGFFSFLFHASNAQTQAPQGPTPHSGLCEDQLANCASYGSQACSGVYLPWATVNCPKTCNLCPGATPPNRAPCLDTLTTCAAYDTQQACSGVYLTWATDNCRKTCNLCLCEDKLSDCQQYRQYACVGHYEDWAREHCAKTCNLCQHSAQQTQTTQPPNPSCALPTGQTLLMKAVAGAPGDVWHLWTSPNTANDDLPQAVTLDSHVVSHYKSALANELDTCGFDTIKVSIYKDCVEKASLVFSGRLSAQSDWFSGDRLLYSSFGDLSPTLSASVRFQMEGDPMTGREFYVGGPGNSCDGSGWFFVSTRKSCPYEAHGPKPAFLYASGHTKQPFQPGYLESGDVLAIFGQGGSCTQGKTTPSSARTPSCVYKSQRYQPGQWWQDGCQFNCTCEHGPSGFYKCFDLCVTYADVPADCPLVKDPGECCAKPRCHANRHTGCTYKSHTYAKGETWTDGCDFRCSCQDAASGRYECTTRCLDFTPPHECHMLPPLPGKCCSRPVCPHHIHIQYPDGYVAD